MRLGFRCPSPAMFVACVALVVALIAGAPGALAASPCGTGGQFSQSGTRATCTYTNPGTEDRFTVPAGVSTVSVMAIGAPGGAINPANGGLGARVSNLALPVTPAAGLWVDVGGPGVNQGGSFDGGNGGSGTGGPAGGGGGSSALLTVPRASAPLTGNVASDSRLLVAGGGGGASGAGFSGGSAGDTAVTGGGAGTCFADGGDGGVGPTDGTDGGGPGCGAAAGSAARGGDGHSAPFPNAPASGGGGGGGWFGGGGGGSAAAGGGGGGSSYGGAGPASGVSIATASSSDVPELVISYAVSAPTASITSPANGATYAQGRVVNASFTCTEGARGPGIASCVGTVPNGSAIATNTPGRQTFTVTATSEDGQRASRTVSYTIRPSNEFTVAQLKTAADGTIRFSVRVPNPGSVDVLETAWKDNLASAAVLLKPAPHRFVFARAHVRAARLDTLNVTVTPNQRGRHLLAGPGYRIVLRLWVSYTPDGGRDRTIGYLGLHLPSACTKHNSVTAIKWRTVVRCN